MTRPSVRIVVGEPSAAGSVPLASVGDEPFSLAGTTVTAIVDTPEVACSLLRTVARGADAVVRVDLPDPAGFLDAIERIADRSTSAPSALDTDQRRLLELLASGVTAADAARRIGMSLRTAHRRLGAARTALGVSTNTEAIARLHLVS